MSTTLVSSTTANGSKPTRAASQEAVESDGNSKITTIVLATVFSVVGVLLFIGVVLMWLRYRKRRLFRFVRGISPIDDDEIATWKTSPEEKTGLVVAEAEATSPHGSPGHTKHASTSSGKKSPSVIIYPSRPSQNSPRRSGETSPRSVYSSYGKTSFDKELPRTPVQAIAPNARTGLTDETVPGDDPFLPSPRRQPSRLSKTSPTSSSRSVRAHRRSKSSRTSTRSFGDFGRCAGPDVQLSPRMSHDDVVGARRSSHSRVYSSPSIPPRLSLGEDRAMQPLPPRALLRACEIGRAIG